MTRVLSTVGRWLLGAVLCAIPVPPAAALDQPPLSPRERELWLSVLTPYLADSLWSARGRYDAGHLLMVPLHAAFTRDYDAGQTQLAEHFQRFVAHRAAVQFDPESELSWVHYLYLCSRFVVLAQENGRPDLVPPELPGLLRGWVADLWLRTPSWQWERPPFEHGMGERVKWKLQSGPLTASYYVGWRRLWRHFSSKPVPGYYRGIIDTEVFLFAIAADLRRWGQLAQASIPADPVLEDIGRTALEAYYQRVHWTGVGGWLFQPGIWAEHPDYAFACRTQKVPNLDRCPVPGIAEDASHSHRTALWLRSLAAPYPPGSSERRYYSALLSGLEVQFLDLVAVPPNSEFPSWRVRNFMDGRNGVYRWGYTSQGPNEGYGPFENSGTLLLGWWSFLGGDRIRALYSGLAARFPLPAEVVRLYTGPGTTRERDETAAEPNFFTNGAAELICRLAARID